MTSWTARIKNVTKVVRSIMSNTVKPDRLYLNLSSEEFKDTELPKDLTELFNSDERLIINWVGGENTKSMKKMFPILQYLDDDDIIMEMDDDFLPPVDLIECRLRDFNSYGGFAPISGSIVKSQIGDSMIMASTPMFSKKMVANWERFVDDTVLHTYNDDRTLLYIFWLNGYVVRPCTRYTAKMMKRNNPINPVKPLKGQYPIGSEYDRIVKNSVYNLTGTDIMHSFNFFHKTEINHKKVDVVMPYTTNGIASTPMTVGHPEIELVVRSVRRFCTFIDRIFVVGSVPPDEVKDEVIHVPCEDPYTHCKDANIIHKIRTAILTIPDLSEDFLMASDDQIVTRECSWEDFKPRIVRKWSDWTEEQWRRNANIDFWHRCLSLTLRKFGKKAAFFEPHIWSPKNKLMFMQMCDKYNYTTDIGCIVQSLYYNFINEEQADINDNCHLSRERTEKTIDKLLKMDREDYPLHLSWCDKAYSDKRFRNILEKIVFEE